ncbi:MAG TPA: NTP transferase domain-containing protein [Candidatus Bathyarchaeia archaeon]|nr:NTP transferase domain-containing protein [Candidatus Bathyarchaeia archaeon]
MAGGKGERLGSGGVEKPLLEFRGRPLIEHVLAALNKSQIERVVTVTSPRTPCTTRWAREASVQVVKAPGQGYVQDYRWASKRLGLKGPVLIIAADLPLIDYRLIDRIIEHRAKAESSALGVYLPYEFCDEANVTPDLTLAADAKLLVPTGINIVDASYIDQLQQETTFIIRDESLLYNINRKSDLKRLVRRASAVGERELE